MRLASLAIVSLLGCGGHAATQPATARVEHPAPTPRPSSPPPEIRELTESVERLPRGSEPTPAAIASALSHLADVVRASDPDAAREIDRLSGQLVQSNAEDRAAHVRRALATALDTLAAGLPDPAPEPVQRSYVLARRAVDELASGQPPNGQVTQVTAALRSMTNLAALLQDARPPFAEAPKQPELGYDADELQSRAGLASAAVAELARGRDWEQSGTRTAYALDTLANVIEVAPLSASPATWRTLVLSVRFQAIELGRLGALTLERSDRIKAGLASCVDALEQIAGARRAEPLRRFVANARSAVNAIDASRSWVFQRGLLQEAFRTTADAFLVVASANAEPSPVSARR